MISTSFRIAWAFAVLIALPEMKAAVLEPPSDASSDWSLRVWPSSELKGRNVIGVIQTEDGYLWIAKSHELLRFDGVRLETIPQALLGALETDRIVLFSRGRTGGFWVVLGDGKVIRVRDQAARLIGRAPVGARGPDSFVEDTTGAVWVAWDGGVARLHGGTIDTFAANEGVEPGEKTLTCDVRGRIWLGQRGSASVFVDGRFVAQANFNDAFVRVSAAAAGGIRICTGAALIAIDRDGKREDLGIIPNRNAVRPTVAMEDKNGALWIGTRSDGLFRYANGRVERIPTSHPRISALCEDDEGNIWATTLGGGLDRIRPEQVVIENASGSSAPDSIISLCQDHAGEIWAVTLDGRLVRRSDGKWVDAPESRIVGRASCVAAGENGVIWVGTPAQRLWRIDPDGARRLGAREGLASQSVRRLFFDHTGALWIIAPGPESLSRYRNGAFDRIDLPDKAGAATAIAEDSTGRIWIGTREGVLLRVEGDRAVEETAARPEHPRPVSALCATSDELWIGYQGGGLGCWRDGQYFALSGAPSLPDDYITELVDDDRGWLWCAGVNQGVFKAPLAELLRAGTLRANVDWLRYGPVMVTLTDNGVPLRSADGRVWIPTGTALVVANPRGDEFTGASPLRITRLSVDGRVIAKDSGAAPLPSGQAEPLYQLADASAHLRIGPGRHQIEVGFACLTFGAPENVRYRYRIEGLDTNWVDGGNAGSAVYSAVPPGDYRFEVRGCNSAGVWSPATAAVAFTVAPHAWQRWWFQAVAGLLAAVIIFSAAWFIATRRLRNRARRLQQEAALASERARIARDIHDDVGNRLTQIVLLSGLAAQSPAGSPEATERLRQISDSAEAVTNALDEIVWAVNPRHDTLAALISYLGQFAVTFLRTAGIPCTASLPPVSPPGAVAADVRHNFFLAVKEALGNVAGHSGATEASFELEITGSEILACVRDNGRGFTGEPQDAQADGLRNMRHRMQEIGGRCEIESVPGRGTKVSFRFRWAR